MSEKPILAFIQQARLAEQGWEWTPFGWPMKKVSAAEWEAECSAWMARTQSERERSKVAELTSVKAS